MHTRNTRELMRLMKVAPRRPCISTQPPSCEGVRAGWPGGRAKCAGPLAFLPADGWERPFRHPNWGQLKFYQLVNVLPQHDHAHARQLADLKVALTPAQS